ncbi:MAG: exosortase system-associated protein, TIGR04073 family [Candidatus Omnitrophica bacterium]|nr:exosortase system-associated protein, TIGR04073 family [Candidatus Omnitrophota bacterium]
MLTVYSTFVKKVAISASLAALILSVSMVAEASDAKSDWPPAQSKKFNRGVTNALSGLREIPNTTNQMAEERSGFEALTTGLPRGIGRAIARTGAGIYEAATFLIPAPEDFEPVMEPVDTDDEARGFRETLDAMVPGPLEPPKQRIKTPVEPKPYSSNISPKRSRAHGWMG